MKQLILAIAVMLAYPAATRAQITSGTVRYQETISFNLNLEGEAAQFAAMMPKEQKLAHTLYFTADESMFQPAGTDAKRAGRPQGGGMQIRMDAPQETYYTNLRDGQSISLRELFGRKFLVAGGLRKQSWKLTGRRKTLLGYTCQEAVQHGERDTVTAWFTTAIPVSSGPRGLSGLPGLILETSSGTMSVMVATAVEPGVVPAGAIAAPKGGKKVTEEQFRRIVDEKMVEMGGSSGSGGNQIMIKVQHN